MSDVLSEVRGSVGFITLNRPRALNALSLDMIRELTRVLLAWQADDAVQAVAIRGSHKDGVFGAFCAGGDIRFFHQAALGGDSRLEDFFTEEYSLNHLIHHYGKPYIAFMDGIVMGGGMGISQGASLRIVTERTKMAMPETNIGLFPDVGGGYFLSRCPGHVGEYLALTGQVIDGPQALTWTLADAVLPASALPVLWDKVGSLPRLPLEEFTAWIAAEIEAMKVQEARGTSQFDSELDRIFALDSVAQIIEALEASPSEVVRGVGQVLRQRSPLMLHVVLEQIRRARHLNLADDLRLERDLVRHCFQLRPGAASETVEGVRALAVDKDHQPRWNPARIEDVRAEDWQAFFVSPWPTWAHPLRDLR